jgi:hypothetical protein
MEAMEDLPSTLAVSGACSGFEIRLLGLLQERGAQSMDQLTVLFPTVSWSQLFLAVDRLSRTGLVSLKRIAGRGYQVSRNRAA